MERRAGRTQLHREGQTNNDPPPPSPPFLPVSTSPSSLSVSPRLESTASSLPSPSRCHTWPLSDSAMTSMVSNQFSASPH